MAGRSFSRKHYMDLADAKGLRFIGSTTPKSVFTETWWKCQSCGKTMKKAYRSLKDAEFGCSCQNRITKKPQDYYDLAVKLGIEWVPEKGNFPSSTKVKTRWRNRRGEIIEATYHQLGYNRISNVMRERLGLEEEPEFA